MGSERRGPTRSEVRLDGHAVLCRDGMDLVLDPPQERPMA
jgi:hypothetical protein